MQSRGVVGGNMCELLLFHVGEEGLRVEGHVDGAIGFVDVVVEEVLDPGELEEGGVFLGVAGGGRDDECDGVVIEEGEQEVEVGGGEEVEREEG